MANNYRIRQDEPSKFTLQMATVSGWIDCESASSIGAAKELIRARKAKEDWVPKYYDENGDLAGDAPATNQPLQDA